LASGVGLQFFTIELCECSFIFTKVDEELEHFPSFSCFIEFRSPNLSGKCRSPWFEHDAINKFISDLKKLLETRRGSASFESVSPGEFKFLVSNSDLLGHLEVKCEIKERHFDLNMQWSVAIESRIEPDQGEVLIGGFSAFQ
jgi:hypothetical protein